MTPSPNLRTTYVYSVRLLEVPPSILVKNDRILSFMGCRKADRLYPALPEAIDFCAGH